MSRSSSLRARSRWRASLTMRVITPIELVSMSGRSRCHAAWIMSAMSDMSDNKVILVLRYSLRTKRKEASMRTVVVSGAGTGIGRAIAQRFALGGDMVHILGRRVGVLAQTAERINDELGGEFVHAHRTDVSDLAQVQALAAEVLPTTVDVVVNNAGGA